MLSPAWNIPSPRLAFTALTAVLLMCSPVFAQFGEDWALFIDPETDEECGIVNTAQLELTVIERTGEFVIINGRDTVLDRLFVDTDNTVYYNGFRSGSVVFADDADGYPTVFWVTDRDTVVEVDEESGEPLDSGLLPEEIGNTGCDPCDLVDDRSLCDDPSPVIDSGAGLTNLTIACGSGAMPAMIPALLLLTIARWVRRG